MLPHDIRLSLDSNVHTVPRRVCTTTTAGTVRLVRATSTATGFVLLLVTGLLGIAAQDLDLVGYHSLLAILHLERDILDNEGPDLIAETVRIERALYVMAKRMPTVSCRVPSGRNACNSAASGRLVVWFTLN
jgi:hypothetical protein